MRIKKIELKNYRCFEDLEIDFDDNLTVIVGNNGAGKTAILEALAISLGTFFDGLDGIPDISISKSDARLIAYDMGDGLDVQGQYPVEIESMGQFDGKVLSWKRTLDGEKGRTTRRGSAGFIKLAKTYQKRLREGDKELVLPVLAYYGTGRLWDTHRKKTEDVFKTNTKTNGYIDCLNGTANVKLMMDWFRKKTIQMAGKDGTALNSYITLPVVYRAMAECFERSTGYKEIHLQYNLDTNEIDCYYTDGEERMRIPLSQMSDGYKGTISLVADIAYRMAVLNPQKGTAAITETDGVVLIDEIDLHLHPAWQHHVLADLQEIFPKVQFIVTTHAPAVISSARSDNLVKLSDFQVSRVHEEIHGNDINSLLKQVMDVSDRNPEVASLFDRFHELLGAKNYDAAENALDDIAQKRNYHDQEVARCRVKLRLERLREGQNDIDKKRE